MQKLTSKENNDPLLPINDKNLYKLINLPRHRVPIKWNSKGRKRAVDIKECTEVVFKKAKSNPGLGVPENEVSDIITEKMKDTSELNYYSPSRWTLSRCMFQTKLQSALDGRFSMTKATVKKI